MYFIDSWEEKKQNGFSLIFLTLLAFAVFAPSLTHGFIWDDEVLVVGNSLIRSWSNIPAIFTSNFWGGSGSYYRPLPIFLYLVDFKIWGLYGPGFHLTNLLIHILGMMFCFLLLRRNFSWRTAFFVTTLYLAHPISTSQLIGVAGRPGLLEILLLGSLYFLSDSAKSPWKGVLSLVFFGLGILSKESTAVFAISSVAYVFLCIKPEERKKCAWVLAGYWVLLGIYLFFRWTHLPFRMNEAPLSSIADLSLFWRLWTFLKVLMEYLSLMVLPLVVVSERRYVVTTLMNPWPWISILFWTSAWIAAFRKWKANPNFLFGLFWFFIMLGPTSHLIQLPMTLAPHWLYVPSFGLYWILAAGINDRLSKVPSRIYLGILGLLILFYGGRSILRENDWKDPLTLFTRELNAEPDSFLLRTNLGVELFRQKRFKESKAEFLRACELEPRYGTAANNLGAVYEKEGNLVQAEQLYKQSIDQGRDRNGFLNLAGLYYRRGNPPATLAVLQEAQKVYRYDSEIAGLIQQVSGASQQAA